MTRLLYPFPLTLLAGWGNVFYCQLFQQIQISY